MNQGKRGQQQPTNLVEAFGLDTEDLEGLGLATSLLAVPPAAPPWCVPEVLVVLSGGVAVTTG